MPGDDKKEKDKKEPPKEKTWADNFTGYEKYNKNGIKILESTDQSHPFDVVIKDGKKKIIPPLPEGVSPETIDFDHLPDVDEKDYDKTLKGLEDYKKTLVVDKPLMQQFNDFTEWLQDKGYAGNPNMNHLQFSKNALAEYKKDNPNATLNYNQILPIQQEIHKYRDYFIDRIKQGKENINFTPNADYSNIMAWAGTELGKKDDGILGQQTSQFKFPSQYMNEKKPENRIGFVPTPEQQQAGQEVIGGGGNQQQSQSIKTGTGIFYGGKRVGELFDEGDKSVIKFRNDTNYTGEETEIPKADYNKYFGTATGYVQSQKLFDELKAKATEREVVSK